MIILKQLAGKLVVFTLIVFIQILSRLGTSVSTRLLACSLRSLSVSSASTPKNPFLVGKLEEHELRLQPLLARHNNSLIKDVGISFPLWRKKEIFELPLTNKIIENPTTISKVIEEIFDVDKVIDLPTHNSNGDDDTGKQAKNGMIMIRRRKMRKHKLRKLRKKMKFEWAKVLDESNDLVKII